MRCRPRTSPRTWPGRSTRRRKSRPEPASPSLDQAAAAGYGTRRQGRHAHRDERPLAGRQRPNDGQELGGARAGRSPPARSRLRRSPPGFAAGDRPPLRALDEAARLERRHHPRLSPTGSGRSARRGPRSSASRYRPRRTAPRAARTPGSAAASCAAKPTTRSRHSARPIAMRSDSSRGFWIWSRAAGHRRAQILVVELMSRQRCVHHCT